MLFFDKLMVLAMRRNALRSRDDAGLGECPRCGGIAPIGGDCPSLRCVAFREWAEAHHDDEETTP